MSKKDWETRYNDPVYKVEFRTGETDEKPVMRGYAAVFGKNYDVGWFTERVAKGAFSKTIKEADIRALWNHDDTLVLGRNKAGTLRLEEDERGLLIEIDPPDWAAPQLESIKRGDVSQMSFRFSVVKELWDKEYTERELQEVKLYEVSPVTFPASPTTKISARSLFYGDSIDMDAIKGLLFRAEMGAKFNTEETRRIKDIIEKLSAIATTENEPGKDDIHSEDRSHSDKEPETVVNEPGISRHSLEAEIDILNTYLQTFKKV
jgi:uncharacterized protein